MLRLFRVCTLLAAIAAAPLPSITWANGCSQGGNAICPLGDTGQAAAGGATRWNVWGALGQNQVAYSFQPVRSSGNINLVMGGHEYRWWQSAW